ncbi:O-antigen ligase family protein [Candidatus Nomurabacteria bacterium]|nr:O-antigen ligase family protein [Candidatus Nomurabacteria bacterium]
MKNLLSQLKKQSLLVRILAIGWLTLIVLLPFHAFISTWGGTSIGPLNLWKAWKEILLSILVVIVIAQSFVDVEMFKFFWKSWITRLIVFYGLLHVLVTLIIGNQASPLAFGLAINLRIVSMFLVGGVVFYYLKPDKKELMKLLIVPAVLVILFGLLQMFILPYDLLSHFGYKEGVTIAPFNTIDQQIDQLRIMSTLRGPNPLGAYLILPGILLLGLIISVIDRFKKESGKKSFKNAIVPASLLLGMLIVLYGSHSRSAWLGFVVSGGVYLMVKLSTKWRLILVSIGLVGLVVGALGLYQLRDTSFVQNVILHDNPEVGPAQTSNSDHTLAIKNALGDIKQDPLTGCAPGCAGPASFYDPDGVKLSENYYLQVAQEVGVVGLGLFIAINILVGIQLFKRRQDVLALALFASLIGLSIANLLLHVWADDTLAYIWWGLAGAVLVSARTSDNKKRS